MMAQPHATPAPEEIAFPDGLVGLPDLVRFERIAFEEPGLAELLSLDDPEFRFIAAEADAVRPGMTAELVEKGLATGDAEVLVLLSVHGEPPGITANLAGPLVIAGGIGRQLLLEDPAFPLRASVAVATE
jgi:flagellar assembly factor FliW